MLFNHGIVPPSQWAAFARFGVEPFPTLASEPNSTTSQLWGTGPISVCFLGFAPQPFGEDHVHEGLFQLGGGLNDPLLGDVRDSEELRGTRLCSLCDEPGDASHGLIPDHEDPTRVNARMNALWDTFMAGGAGVEWYFGYQHDHSDLTCQDWRSREKIWEQCRPRPRLLRAAGGAFLGRHGVARRPDAEPG
jgi:hypothetical protein